MRPWPCFGGASNRSPPVLRLWEPSSRKEHVMTVARVTEISATSTKSFEDAIAQGVARATKTLRNVRSAWVKEQRIEIENGQITGYQVNMLVTFILDD
jgi:flavin-binding protein dodecin